MIFSDDVANHMLDAIELGVGRGPVFKLWSGEQPADCNEPDSGDEIATVVLPMDWMQTAIARQKKKSPEWPIAVALEPGIVSYYRIYSVNGVCQVQGSVTPVGGGGDLELANVDVPGNAQIVISEFSWRFEG